jgi:hypothetical protein
MLNDPVRPDKTKPPVPDKLLRKPTAVFTANL